MKLVTAIIRPSKLDEIRTLLADLGVAGMTICEVRGCAQQAGPPEVYRASEHRGDLLPRIQIETVLDDPTADRAVELIRAAARSGSPGDGKLLVLDLERAARIRTGERGPGAL